MSELDDLIKRFQIDDSLLSEAFKSNAQDKGKTLLRIQDCLATQRFDDSARERGTSAVKVLRLANRVRVGLQHSGDEQRRLPETATALGMAWPPRTWAEAWDVIRARVRHALRELREVLREDDD